MPETIENFHTALKARLSGDSGLSSWATTHFGQAFTLKSGRKEAGPVRDEEFPAIVIDVAESDEEFVVLGGDRSRTQATFVAKFVWREETPANVFAQRLQIHDRIRKAMLGDTTFGGTVGVARGGLIDVSEDTEEPEFAVGLLIQVEYDLVKS